MATAKNTQPFRVLSLDGGGMRGTYTATFIERVAEGFSKRRGVGPLDVGVAFDLIVGTSTGGIIACALAAGVPMGRVVQLYRAHGAAIFKRSLPENLRQIAVDIFARSNALAEGEKALRSALQDVLGDVTIRGIYGKRGIGLAIPAVEMSQHRSWVFKTPHFKDTNHRDDSYQLVDVCLATTAAPIFRSMAAIRHPDGSTPDAGTNVFVDGGLWANNPVLVALVEALDVAAPGQPIELFCLGTCPHPAGEQIAPSDIHRGLVQWKFGGKAAELAIDAQQFAYDHMAKKIAKLAGRTCDVIRFPADKVPAAVVPYLGLDDTRTEAMEALVNQARTDADMTNSKCSNAATDREAVLIKTLFETMPVRSDPLLSRAQAIY